MTASAALAAIAVALLMLGLRARRPRLAVEGPPAVLRVAARLPVPAAVRRLGARPPTSERIAAAGLEGAIGPALIARARAGAAGAGAVTGLVVAPLAPAMVLVGVALAALGFVAPDLWLRRRAARRRRAIEDDLPDLLDLLGVCVGAGMPLDAALATAAGGLRGPLGDEVRRALRELSLGTRRREAYRMMSERTAVPQLTRTLSALIQADELGTPLSAALAAQADELRGALHASARERAARAAPKIQLVIALVMVPAVLLLVMGVLLFELSRQVGTVVGG